jgi:calcineurin-like phosphoesterase
MKFLIIGDIVGASGVNALKNHVPSIVKNEGIDFIIINGENISHGKGMNQNHYKWLMSLGANVITMGNHTWNNRQIFDYIDESNSIVRPYNYGKEYPGKGYVTVNYNGLKITVFQMLGKTFMDESNLCPFKKTEEHKNL